VRHGRVVVANQVLELREGEPLVHIARRLFVGVRKIVRAKCTQLIVHDRIQFTRRRHGDDSLSKTMGDKSCDGAEREKENKKSRFRDRGHDFAVSARRRKYL